jgi:uncharacterized caspase-like protein
MSTPGLEIGSVMKRVRADVIKSTRGEQVPFDESGLITDARAVSGFSHRHREASPRP